MLRLFPDFGKRPTTPFALLAQLSLVFVCLVILRQPSLPITITVGVVIFLVALLAFALRKIK